MYCSRVKPILDLPKGEAAGRTLCAIYEYATFKQLFHNHNKHIANLISIVSDNLMWEAALSEKWKTDAEIEMLEICYKWKLWPQKCSSKRGFKNNKIYI